MARGREGGSVRARAGLAVVVLCAVVTAAGCSKVGTTTNTSAHDVNPWTEHGVLRIIANQEPNSLLRLFSNQAAADDMTALLFEPMFRYDDRGDPVPALATTFPTEQNGLISKDGLRITFKLEPKARWSDGSPSPPTMSSSRGTRS